MWEKRLVCALRRMKIDHFQKNNFKFPALGANDRQFDPELRTVFLFSANSLNFSALRFLSFEKSKGGHFDDKNLKKIDFYV